MHVRELVEQISGESYSWFKAYIRNRKECITLAYVRVGLVLGFCRFSNSFQRCDKFILDLWLMLRLVRRLEVISVRLLLKPLLLLKHSSLSVLFLLATCSLGYQETKIKLYCMVKGLLKLSTIHFSVFLYSTYASMLYRNLPVSKLLGVPLHIQFRRNFSCLALGPLLKCQDTLLLQN